MMRAATDNRRAALAKIHIGAEALGMDTEDKGPDSEYRRMLWNVARVHSAADLDEVGRRRVLDHLKKCGFRPKRRPRTRPEPNRATPAGAVMASAGQVKLIRSIWIQMADAGVVHDRTEQALRRWIRSTTRKYHPQKAGYSAPEFLPERAAQHVIEQLKGWAKRCAVTLDD